VLPGKNESVVHMEYCSALEKSEITLFGGKHMELEDIMLSKVSKVQTQRSHVFSHMWKIDPKDKCIDKKKHDHVHIYISNMFVIIELAMELGEEGKEKIII
jgi:hypothetical protein